MTYNLASDTGRTAYTQGKRFKTAGIKKETLSDIVETRTSQPGKGLKGELANRFGTRPDVAYNLATNQGRAAYEATPGFAGSGIGANELMRYATAVAERSPLPTRSAGSASSMPVLTTPVYARSYANAWNGSSFPNDTAIARTVGSAAAPFNAARVSVDEVVTLGKKARERATQTGTAIAVIPAMAGSGADATRRSETLPTSKVGASGASAIPTTGAGNSAPAMSATPSLTAPRKGNDPELERLRRIEANYEKDKAMLAKEKAPALARNASHDVGHAEGTEDAPDLKKVAHKLGADIANELRSRKG